MEKFLTNDEVKNNGNFSKNTFDIKLVHLIFPGLSVIELTVILYLGNKLRKSPTPNDLQELQNKLNSTAKEINECKNYGVDSEKNKENILKITNLEN